MQLPGPLPTMCNHHFEPAVAGGCCSTCSPTCCSTCSSTCSPACCPTCSSTCSFEPELTKVRKGAGTRAGRRPQPTAWTVPVPPSRPPWSGGAPGKRQLDVRRGAVARQLDVRRPHLRDQHDVAWVRGVERASTPSKILEEHKMEWRPPEAWR